MKGHHETVLAVHPTRTGFGWVVFEGPQNPVDWGTAAITQDRNKGCLKRINALIDKFQPGSVVLEAFDRPTSRRHKRIRRLCRDILDLANDKHIETHVYARADIQACFEDAGGGERYEIAKAIAARFDMFAHYLPPLRKIWMPEDPRMGLFAAIAVALTHYWLADQID